MFNNLSQKFLDFCFYLLSIKVYKKKNGFGKNRYRQVTTHKKIAIGASLTSDVWKASML